MNKKLLKSYKELENSPNITDFRYDGNLCFFKDDPFEFMCRVYKDGWGDLRILNYPETETSYLNVSFVISYSIVGSKNYMLNKIEKKLGESQFNRIKNEIRRNNNIKTVKNMEGFKEMDFFDPL